MKSYQRKLGWVVAASAVVAMWTACAPDFSDDVCATKEDCFPNEVCLANACVVVNQTNDVGNDTDDVQTDAENDIITPELNACNGMSDLDHEPDEPCGPCDLDKYICDGKDNTVCNGDTACPEIALVATNPTGISPTGAMLHGKIQSLSNDLPTDHGFCWSKEVPPTGDNGECHSLGALTADKENSDFTYTIGDLAQGTTYYVRAFHTDTNGKVYANIIEFTTLAPFPTNFSATTGTETAFVKLEWDDMPGATEYFVYRDDVLLGVVESDTTSFDDTHAEAGSLTAAKNLSASQGTSAFEVVLHADPAITTPGKSLPYSVRASYPNAESAQSPAVQGYRGTGPISYQWERSLTEVSQNFSPLAGLTDLNTQDPTAPPTGEKRFYRLVASIEGPVTKTSSAVSGYLQARSLPSLSTVIVSEITNTGAKTVVTLLNLGNPPATEHGFCAGTAPAPDTDCVVLGTPPASGTFESTSTELSPGTTYFVRAFLTVGATRYYSTDTSFTTLQTLPPTPTGVTATSDDSDLVRISWTSVPGAVSYKVLRNGTVIGNNVTQTFYDDTGADPPGVASAPTLTTTDSPEYVTLSWTASTTSPGPQHTYTVRAVNSAGEGPASAAATGRRAARTITGYQFRKNSAAWTDVALATTHNDTTAPPPIIGPGIIAVEANKPIPGHNLFTIISSSIQDGASVTYTVRAVTGPTDGTTSAGIPGKRNADTLNFQWQYKEQTGTTFSVIDAQTGLTWEDISPDFRRIRVRVHSTGAADVTSNEVISTPP